MKREWIYLCENQKHKIIGLWSPQDWAGSCELDQLCFVTVIHSNKCDLWFFFSCILVWHFFCCMEPQSDLHFTSSSFVPLCHMCGTFQWQKKLLFTVGIHFYIVELITMRPSCLANKLLVTTIPLKISIEWVMHSYCTNKAPSLKQEYKVQTSEPSALFEGYAHGCCVILFWKGGTIKTDSREAYPLQVWTYVCLFQNIWR